MMNKDDVIQILCATINSITHEKNKYLLQRDHTIAYAIAVTIIAILGWLV